MITADTTEKVRLQNNNLFSDMVNGVLFHGNCLIDPIHLHSYDSHESTYIHLFGIDRTRDMIKKYEDGYIILIGIENQSQVDETMPIRLLGYDFINYMNQQKIFSRDYKLITKHNKDYPEDKKKLPKLELCPVMSIVINYGERRWNKSVTLKGMMKSIPKVFEDYINDWGIKVIDIIDVDYKKFQHKDNRDLVLGIQRLYESQGEVEVLEEMDMSYETAIELFSITNSKDMLEIVKGIKKEEFQMCTAMEIFKKRTLEIGEGIGFEKGEVSGIEKGKQFGINIIINMFKQGLSIEKIAQYTNLKQEEVTHYLDTQNKDYIH